MRCRYNTVWREKSLHWIREYILFWTPQDPSGPFWTLLSLLYPSGPFWTLLTPFGPLAFQEVIDEDCCEG
ncbi:hypothetical protein B0O80DRAFT_444026 [Mortierella sp. GBAus27b]|nr:hypothetical protein B0O80DRAFT_444026 [Mortierella sp. GBAus27b]